MDRHYHPRRRRAGWIFVIRAGGASKAFVPAASGQAGHVTPVGKHWGIGSRGIWRAARMPLAHGQKRHQLSVVLVILGEQSGVISRECRSVEGCTFADRGAFGIDFGHRL
jgi:hypothetical protein